MAKNDFDAALEHLSRLFNNNLVEIAGLLDALKLRLSKTVEGLSLESNPVLPRDLHTLKGELGICGFKLLAAKTGEAEIQANNGPIDFSLKQELSELLRNCVVQIDTWNLSKEALTSPSKNQNTEK